MLRQWLAISSRNTLVAVIASSTLVSSALAQRPVPDQSTVELAGTNGDFQFEAKNAVASVSTAEKSARVTTLLREIALPAGLASQLRIKNASQELKATLVEKDTANKWHVRFQQFYKGIPVTDGVLAVHKSDDPNAELTWNGSYMADPEVDIVPKISRQQAIGVVETAVRAMVQREATAEATDAPNPALRVQEPATPSTAVLEIHPGKGPGQRLLTYHVTVSDFSGSEPISLEAWVDNSGRIVEAYNNIQTACQSGTGMTFYQGNASYFKVAFANQFGVYVTNDNCLRIGTYDMFQGTSTTYQASSNSTVFGNHTLANRNSTNADIHYATVQTDSFIFYILGRDFIDGNGGPRVFQSVDGQGPLVSARNHYGNRYNNAFWNDNLRMISFGDGDGNLFRSFATLDIVGHEWTHGLTFFTARLKYLNESGALNESFSDIMGTMTERYWKGESANTWKVGEGAYTPNKAGDALRYMDRPTKDGSSRDHYSQRYVGTQDSGGVHWNSGIQNNAFYLLAKGGCHRLGGCMTSGIGAPAATQIFWRALRFYLVSSSGFSAAKQATLRAAKDLYGQNSVNYNRTLQAWNLVGVP